MEEEEEEDELDELERLESVEVGGGRDGIRRASAVSMCEVSVELSVAVTRDMIRSTSTSSVEVRLAAADDVDDVELDDADVGEAAESATLESAACLLDVAVLVRVDDLLRAANDEEESLMTWWAPRQYDRHGVET